MKNKIYITILICLVFTFSSCDKFLDVKPANQIVVQTLDDVQKVLGGFLAITSFAPFSPTNIGGSSFYSAIYSHTYFGVHHYTDEFSFYEWGENNGFNYMNFEDYENLADFKSVYQGKTAWDSFYSTIGYMNTLIDEVSGITEGDDAQRDFILGEVYTNTL